MQKNKLNKGTALIVMMALFVAAAGFSSASLVVSVSSLQSSSGNGAVAMARTIANSGLEYATAELKRRAELSQGDFSVLDSLAATNPVYQNRPLDVPSVTGTKTLGTFTVNMKTVESNSKERVYFIESVGQVDNGRSIVKNVVSANVRFSLAKSPAFQHCYFMNHFGWMSAGGGWIFNGNMGAAGVFNWYHSPLEVNGTPQFDEFDPDTMQLGSKVAHTADGSAIEGGTIAGFEIEGGENITGAPYREYANQKMFNMPLLNQEYFSKTREEAYTNGSYVKVGENYISDGVYGDQELPPADLNVLRDELETSGYNASQEVASGNLYLEGTDANPIEINGKIVVEGNLFIKGKVTGQGAFSVRGNIYIGGEIEYVNPPADPSSATDKETIETWISDNFNKDSLGLYAKGGIAAGNYNTYIKNGGIKNWLNISVNESSEHKNGYDGMPNTGDDGETGADADIWNVSYYTAEDAAAGRIPEVSKAGDVIPGSGEDFDGDGKQDSRITQADFVPRSGNDMEASHSAYETVNSTTWGNAPAGINSLASLSTNTIRRLDAVLFTNKAFISYMTGSGPMIWNGALISRLEAAVLGGNWVFNFDHRLLGGGGNDGFSVPAAWDSVKVYNYKTDTTETFTTNPQS